jgi:oligopeptide transport system substrate-binding protein
MKVLWTLFLGLSLLLSFSCAKKQDLSKKVLSLTASAKIKGFDPIQGSDSYSSSEIARVYEGLLQFHYLKRPYELEPNLAEAMPQVSKDGLTYTFKIKKGVKFHDDACFEGGKGREMKAQDVVYSIKRLADAHNVASGWWLLDGKIKGLNEWRKKYAPVDASNYDDTVEGLKALDDYTVQFKLTRKFPQFLYALAMTFTYVVPNEAVAKYGKEFINHPVGTGPFVLKSPFSSGATKITYIKNPNYRDVFFPTTGADSDKSAGLLNDAGKKIPFVDEINVMVQTEAQPRWLSFEKGKVDYLAVPKDNFDSVVIPGKGMTDAYAKKGIALHVTPDLDITYIAFNHDEKIFQNSKLKQAMSMAYNRKESNELFYNNMGVVANAPTPPGVAGNAEGFKNPYVEFNLEKAKKKLAEAGFPEGKGLPVMYYEALASTTSRQMAEYFAKSMAKIGVQIKVNTNTWPQLTDKIKKRKAQMWGISWIADYPDAENFLQLFYGPNSSPGANGSNFNDPWFNETYEKAAVMQHSPERSSLYDKLNKYIAEKVPWILGVHRKSFVTVHGWLKNYKYSVFSHGNAKYINVDLNSKKQLLNNL